MKIFPAAQTLIWLIQTEPGQPGKLHQQLPPELARSIRPLELEAALHSLTRQIRPRMILLEGRPDRAAETALTQLKSRDVTLPIFLINEWADAAEIQSWLSKSIVAMVRPRSESEWKPSNAYKLSHRELEILRCMVKGLIKKEIAEELSISYHTVDNHERNIFRKLQIHTRSGAVAKALIEKIC